MLYITYTHTPLSAIICPNLTIPDQAFLDTPSRLFDTTVNVTCHVGHYYDVTTMERVRWSRCMENGVWDTVITTPCQRECHCQSLSVSSSHCESQSGTVSHLVNVSHCQSLSQSLSVTVCHCMSLSVIVSQCQSIWVTGSHCRPMVLSLCLLLS